MIDIFSKGGLMGVILVPGSGVDFDVSAFSALCVYAQSAYEKSGDDPPDVLRRLIKELASIAPGVLSAGIGAHRESATHLRCKWVINIGKKLSEAADA